MKKAFRGKYRILASENLAPDVFELKINASDIATASSAGQFVNVYPEGGAMLLPRPISIADAKNDTIVLAFAVVGAGTESMANYKNGDHIELMGPLGNGFFSYGENEKLPEPKEVLLIGGGTGIPPLRFAASELKREYKSDVKLTACLGFAKQPWYKDDFEQVCDEVKIGSETEGEADFKGNVIKLMDTVFNGNGRENPELALACGPRPMLEAAAKWCEYRGIPLRVSLEERMGCGYGVCAGCAVKPRNSTTKKKVCSDGPVFWAEEVKW